MNNYAAYDNDTLYAAHDLAVALHQAALTPMSNDVALWDCLNTLEAEMQAIQDVILARAIEVA